MGLIKFFCGLGRRKHGTTSNFTRELASKETRRRERLAAPGTRVYFDDDLIEKLKLEHQVLLRLFTRMSEAYQAEKYKAVSKLLEEFKGEIYSHFLLENVKLYIYLRNVLRQDAQNMKIMREFQREINQIGKALDQFLDRYIKVQWTEAKIMQFGDELDPIGHALVSRIRKEEDVLYPLYLPPDAYIG